MTLQRDRLFPSVEHDTIVAQTFRWFLDLETPDVPKAELSHVYNAYAVLKHPTRVSGPGGMSSHIAFSWNKDKRTHAMIESYIHTETLLRKDGKPRTRAVTRHERSFNADTGYLEWRSVPTGERKPVTRRTERVRWIGPSPAEWLQSLTPMALDRAFAMMERRFTSDDGALTYFMKAKWSYDEKEEVPQLRYKCANVRRDDREPIDERALAKRWLDRITAEIARRDALAHAA